MYRYRFTGSVRFLDETTVIIDADAETTSAAIVKMTEEAERVYDGVVVRADIHSFRKVKEAKEVTAVLDGSESIDGGYNEKTFREWWNNL